MGFSRFSKPHFPKVIAEPPHFATTFGQLRATSAISRFHSSTRSCDIRGPTMSPRWFSTMVFLGYFSATAFRSASSPNGWKSKGRPCFSRIAITLAMPGWFTTFAMSSAERGCPRGGFFRPQRVERMPRKFRTRSCFSNSFSTSGSSKSQLPTMPAQICVPP